jgi:hypothetical protein
VLTKAIFEDSCACTLANDNIPTTKVSAWIDNKDLVMNFKMILRNTDFNYATS